MNLDLLPDPAIMNFEGPPIAAGAFSLTGTNNVIVSVNVVNEGAEAFNVPVQLYWSLNGAPFTAAGSPQIIPDIGGNGVRSAALTFFANGYAGTNVYRAIIDPNGTIDDADISNNIAQTSIKIFSLPNLVPTNITFTTSTFVTGRALTAYVVVNNNGIAEADDVLVEVLQEGTNAVLGAAMLSHIGAMSTLTVPVAIDTSSLVGPTDLEAIVNSNQAVLETTTADDTFIQPVHDNGLTVIDPEYFVAPLTEDPAVQLFSQGSFGPQHLISSAATDTYLVAFENQSDSQAATQELQVVQDLDPSQDVSTFKLGPYLFDGMTFETPANSTYFTTTLDLAGTLGYNVVVTGGLNPNPPTGRNGQVIQQVIFTFLTVDPATGQVPDDPTIGFLPPNNAMASGEGGFIYTIAPFSTVASGVQITGAPTAAFDTLYTANSPTATQTVDNTAQTSAVTSLSATQSTPAFTVNWSGTDNTGGAGIAHYDVYVSDNGGAYTQFVSDSALTSATFTGVAGHTYAFYSIATDNVLNVQSAPVTADTQTTLAFAAINGSIFNDANNSGAKDLGEGVLSGVTVTLTPTGTTAGSPVTATTIENGSYTFPVVMPGTYVVSETLPNGYALTAPAAGGGVAISSDQVVVGPSFGNVQISTVTLNFNMLVALSQDFNKPGTFANCDLNGDGMVNFDDLVLLSQNYNLTLPAGSYLFSGQVSAGPGNSSTLSIAQAAQVMPAIFPAASAITTAAIAAQPVKPTLKAVVSTGVISGTVFNNTNASGTKQTTEAGLAGRKVYLDISGKGTVGERVATTDSKGNFSFAELPAGSYVLRIGALSGWRVTTPSTGSYNLILTTGLKKSGLLFGQTQTALMSGVLFNDANADGIKQSTESALANRKVYLDIAGKGTAGERAAITDSHGNFVFNDLSAGSYLVRIPAPAGWRTTTVAEASYPVTVTAGATRTNLVFGQTQTAAVSGNVFSDANGDGVVQSGEAGLAGWRVQLLSTAGKVLLTTETNGGGNYIFPAVVAGSYHMAILSQTGYMQITPAGGFYSLNLSAAKILTGENFGEQPALAAVAFTIFSTRVVDPLDPTKDLVTFYARNNGIGAWAGTKDLLDEDVTLASAGGLEIRTYDADGSGIADDADFAGENATPTASYIRIGGPAFFVASTTPAANNDGYKDLRSVPSFEVAGGLFGAGVDASGSAGARIAVAVVPHGNAVSLSGQLAAERGPLFNFSYTD